MAKIPTFFYIDKEKIENLKLSKIKRADWENIMQDSLKFKTAAANKKNKIETLKNYCKIPVEILIANPIQQQADIICMIIATWIFTYSKNHHYINTITAVTKFEIEKEKLEKAIKSNGSKYLLQLNKTKDRYNRDISTISFDTDSYFKLLKTAREADEEEEELF